MRSPLGNISAYLHLKIFRLVPDCGHRGKFEGLCGAPPKSSLLPHCPHSPTTAPHPTFRHQQPLASAAHQQPPASMPLPTATLGNISPYLPHRCFRSHRLPCLLPDRVLMVGLARCCSHPTRYAVLASPRLVPDYPKSSTKYSELHWLAIARNPTGDRRPPLPHSPLPRPHPRLLLAR